MTITTRAGKGSALTYEEMDSNFLPIDRFDYSGGANGYLSNSASGTYYDVPSLNFSTSSTGYKSPTGLITFTNNETIRLAKGRTYEIIYELGVVQGAAGTGEYYGGKTQLKLTNATVGGESGAHNRLFNNLGQLGQNLYTSPAQEQRSRANYLPLRYILEVTAGGLDVEFQYTSRHTGNWYTGVAYAPSVSNETSWGTNSVSVRVIE